MNVGFIGLGIMGSRMAANLVKGGHDVTVFNRTPEKAQALVANGAKLAPSVKDLAQQVDTIITMLAHPEAIRELALGQDGFLAQLKKGSLWIDSSTVNPAFSREMADAALNNGARFLEAPVAGTKAPAKNAELVFFVGGQADDMAKASALFDAMGKKTVHVGEHGMGTSLKLVVNFMLASSMAAFSEGMVFGQKMGLPEELLLNVLLAGPLVPPYLSSKRESLEQDSYEASFPLKWIQKDMQMVSTAAYDVNAAMPLANLTKELYQMAMQSGYSDDDFAAIYKDFKLKANL